MAESYDNLQGNEMDVQDHPSNNIDHPAPGPKGLAGSLDRAMGAGAMEAVVQTAKVYKQLGSDMGNMLSGKKYNSKSGKYE